MSSQLGVPVKLLKECIGKKISVEACNGDVFRGLLDEAEENMSISLSEVKVVLVDGKTLDMESIYIKGSRVRLVNLPESTAEMLPNLTRPQRPVFRGGKRGGFRGGRGGGGQRFAGRPPSDRRRY